MSDEVSNILEGKLLSNLRVVDLKQELEIRGLSKSGSKKELIKRLKQKLELEKLCKESSPLGGAALKLNLDEATERNEFVQQYLADQQKIYAKQKEAKRLVELGEQQEVEKDNDADSSSTDLEEDVDKRGNVGESSDGASEDDEKVAIKTGDKVALTSIDEGKTSDACLTPQNVHKCKEGDVGQVLEGERQNQLSETLEGNCQQTAVLLSSQDVTVQHCTKPGSGDSPSLRSPSTMEPGTQQSMIPYSLADIQLPDSPGNMLVNPTPELVAKEGVKVLSNKVNENILPEEHSTTNSVTNSVEILSGVIDVSSNGEKKKVQGEHDKKPDEVKQDTSKELNYSKLKGIKYDKVKGKSLLEAHKQEEVIHKNERRRNSRFDSKPVSDLKVISSKMLGNKPSKSSVGQHQSAHKFSEDISDNINCVEVKKSAKTVEKVLESTDTIENYSTDKNDLVQKDNQSHEESKMSGTLHGTKDQPEEQIVSDSEEKANSVHSDDTEEEEMNAIKRKVNSKKQPLQAEEGDSEKMDGVHIVTEKIKVEKVSGGRKIWEKSKRSSTSDCHSSSTDSSPERKTYKKARNSDSESNSQNIRSRSCSVASESEQDHSVPKAEDQVKQEVPDSHQNNAPKLRRLKIKRGDGIKIENLPKKIETENCTISPTDPRNNRMLLQAALNEIEAVPNISEQNSTKPVEEPVVKFTPRKLNLTGLKSNRKSTEDNDEKTGIKKRRWGNYTAALPKASLSISTDSLKSLIPDFKVVCGPPVVSEVEDVAKLSPGATSPVKEDKIIKSFSPDSADEEICEEAPKKPVVMEIVEELPEESPENQRMEISSSPQNPSSRILFIKNLVRPFTLLQLKDLLMQTGVIVTDGFWIDKIKSKCFVTYEEEEQAMKTRDTLNGTRWPVSNPKILSVEFSTQEELDSHRHVREQPKLLSPLLPQTNADRHNVRTVVPIDSQKKKERDERKKEKPKQTVTYIREWDKDKISQDSPEADRQPIPKDLDRNRSSEKKKDKKDSKRRQEDDDTPAKLLDDLFQKTKSSPCIYWLPLTEDQVKEREEEKRLRREEREKRVQQQREQEEAEYRARRKERLGREKENRSRSRSPVRRR